MTRAELFDKLRSLEETLLLELLGLDSSMLVDRCLDIIEDNYEYLYSQVDDNDLNGYQED